MDWIKLTSGEELNELISRSHEQPQVIYKHSLRCGTSYLVKENLEDSTSPVNADFHLLDLINFRSVSNCDNVFKTKLKNTFKCIIQSFPK